MRRSQRDFRAALSRWFLPGVLLVAALIRIAHFAEIERSPVVDHHHWDQVDMSTYDRWARIIAAGDWLTDRSFHPVHRWHGLVAASVFRQYPEQRSKHGVTGGMDDSAAAERLWESWTGGPSFHAEPLYPYLVALTYRLFGTEVRRVFVWQSLLGLASLLLVYDIGRRAFGVVAGRVAALLGLLCGPLLFYEMVLLRTTLIAFTGLGLVWSIQLAEATDSRRRWLATGVAFGLAILTKSIFVVTLAGLLGLLFWRHRWEPAGTARRGAMVLLGASLALAPLVARNLAVGAPALALSSVNSTAFAMSNGAHYVPEMNKIDMKEIASILGRTDARFLPTVVETLKTHEDPVAYAGFVWRKFQAAWHGFEMPNNASFYYHRLFSRTLRLLPVTFYLLSPLALVGLLVAAPRFGDAWPLYLLAGTHLLVMLIAPNHSRYRIPLLAVILPFAAWSVVRIFDWLRERRWKRVAAVAAALALLAVWSSRPLPAEVQAVREGDCVALLHWHLEEHGKDAARQYLRTVLGVVPDSLGARLSLGDVERHESDFVEAARQYEKALELDPRNRYALEQLARCYERTGRQADAEEARRRLRETNQLVP